MLGEYTQDVIDQCRRLYPQGGTFADYVKAIEQLDLVATTPEELCEGLNELYKIMATS